MAGLFFVQPYPETLSGTATKTLLQLASPTNQRIRLWEISFSSKGIVPTDAPILVQLVAQTTAGTMTGNNPTVEDPAAVESPQTTGQRDASAEPTLGAVLRQWQVHPQGQILLYQAAGPMDALLIGGGRRVGLRVVTPGVSVLVAAYIRGEE